MAERLGRQYDGDTRLKNLQGSLRRLAKGIENTARDEGGHYGFLSIDEIEKLHVASRVLSTLARDTEVASNIAAKAKREASAAYAAEQLAIKRRMGQFFVDNHDGQTLGDVAASVLRFMKADGNPFRSLPSGRVKDLDFYPDALQKALDAGNREAMVIEIGAFSQQIEKPCLYSFAPKVVLADYGQFRKALGLVPEMGL